MTAAIVCGVVLFLTGASGAILAVIGSVPFLIVTSSITAICGIGVVVLGVRGRRKIRRDDH